MTTPPPYRFVTKDDLGWFILNEHIDHLWAEKEAYRLIASRFYGGRRTDKFESLDQEAARLLEGGKK